MRSHESFSDSSIFTSHTSHHCTSGTRDSKAGIGKIQQRGGEKLHERCCSRRQDLLEASWGVPEALAETRVQKAQLWVFIGGFEQHRQQYPSYDARLAHAISEEAWNDVIGQIRGYMNEKALFRDSTKFSDPCCCCCPPFTCCFCYIIFRAAKILDDD